jgi:glutathione synthase
VRRATLAEISERGRVDDHGAFFLKHSPPSSPSTAAKQVGTGSDDDDDNDKEANGEEDDDDEDEDEVSVCYFRAGYTPTDFPSESEWHGREMVEQAWSCVKCPTLAYHLAGTKKVQQQLAQPGEVR